MKRKKTLELEQLEEDLAKAKQQRTARIYRSGVGFVWEANQVAVKEAQK